VGKLRARAKSVKSRPALQIPLRNRFARATTLLCSGKATAQSTGVNFLLASETRLSLFQSRKFLFALKIKIHFSFIFFLSVLKVISSLKPAGEAETTVHVNKL